MPKELETKLKKEAASKGYSGEKADAFVYGTLRKTGWKPKREREGGQGSGHGSLEDITFHEEAAQSDVVMKGKAHAIHKGYGSVVYGDVDFKSLDSGNEPKGNEGSMHRDIGNGLHYGAPVDYFGPDTDYRAEEIDMAQYGRDYEPIPLRDYYKTEDKQFERGFRLREQDEYDQTPTPGVVTDEQPMSEAYGAVNYQGAGPDQQSGDAAGHCDNRSFESQRLFARTNKEKSQEYAVDISGLDTKHGKDIR